MISLSALTLSGCITPYPDLTQSRSPCRMEPGGWCDFVRQSAVRSYGYAMLSNDAYNDEEKYTDLPIAFKPREARSDEDTGLGYAVFDRFKVKDGQRGELAARVIAFRGTDFGSPEDIFSGTFGTSQIELARKLFSAEIAELPPGVPIELTGHSLGGALATQLSIENPGTRAFVFNTSPFFQGDPMESDIDRVSVSERGEFLRVLRRYKAPPADEVVVINCNPSASAGAKHSIRKLADCLTWIAAYSDEAALGLLAGNAIRKPEVECGEHGKVHPGVRLGRTSEPILPCVHQPREISPEQAGA